jgi:subtilase family serine protease
MPIHSGRPRYGRLSLVVAAAIVLGGCSASHPGATAPTTAAADAGTTQATAASSPAALPAGALDCLTGTPVACYSRGEFLTAYGLTPLLDRGIDGHGETVVLPEFAPVVAAAASDIRQDLALFDRVAGLPAARLEVDTQLAAGASPYQAGKEEVGDAEMVHEVAPGATIRIILFADSAQAGAAQETAAYAKALRLAPSLGQVVSISYGLGESCYTRAEVAAWNGALRADQDQHVTVVASSGDNGAATIPCNGLTASAPSKGVNLPASSPLVLSVGGTSLRASHTTGAYQGETAWNTPAPSDAPIPAGYEPAEATNGGYSTIFPKPGYQAGVTGTGTGRGVPDVAADASPYTGTANAIYLDGMQVIAPSDGTSAGAPFWAAIVALADQYAGHALGFINPAIYRIGRGPKYHLAFHDITTGGNTVKYPAGTITGYQAAPGWDPVTGWGSPDAQVLVPLLVKESA